MMAQMFLAGGQTLPLLDAIVTAGLTTNLKLCLDAGDPQSYSSGDKWLDRSGNGYDFFLGTGIGAPDGDEPTLTAAGTPPAPYWSFGSGDQFTYDTTNETWMENLHKNNAIFSFVAFFYLAASGDTLRFFFNTYTVSSTNVGFAFRLIGDAPSIIAGHGGGGTNAISASGTALSTNAWHMVAVSLNEATGAGGGFLYSDGGYNQVSAADTFTSTYTTPSASSAMLTANIADSNAATGNRLSCLAAWEGTALSKANMDSIWSAMRGRFVI